MTQPNMFEVINSVSEIPGAIAPWELRGVLGFHTAALPTRVAGLEVSDLPGPMFIGLRPPQVRYESLDEINSAGASWKQHGLEAYTRYKPFHFDPDRWGIQMLASGIERIAFELCNRGVGFEIAYEAAYQFLLSHSMAHFQIELVISGIETATGTPIYCPGKEHANLLPECGVSEEAFCTALARDSLPREHRTALDDMLSLAPAGHNHYRRHNRTNRSTSWGLIIDEIAQVNGTVWLSVPQTTALEREVPVEILLDGEELSGALCKVR